jgi:hypothetical protein
MNRLIIALLTPLLGCSLNGGVTNALGQPSISSINISNQTLTITGDQLDSIKQITLSGPRVKSEFAIQSNTPHRVVATAVSATQLALDTAYSLFISNANAASTQATLTFTLSDRIVTGEKLASNISIETTGDIKTTGDLSAASLSASTTTPSTTTYGSITGKNLVLNQSAATEDAITLNDASNSGMALNFRNTAGGSSYSVAKIAAFPETSTGYRGSNLTFSVSKAGGTTPTLSTALILKPDTSVNIAGQVVLGNIDASPSPGVAIEIKGSATTPNKLRLSNGTSYWDLSVSGSQLNFWNGTVTASLSAGGVISTSDQRLKKDFEVIEGAVSKVRQIRGLFYRFKKEPADVPRHAGVIAQEVQKVLPEAVEKNGDYLGVKYSELIPLMIEALKELDGQVETLKKKHNEVEAELTALRKENSHLRESAQKR